MTLIEYTEYEVDPSPADPRETKMLPMLPVTFRGLHSEALLDCLVDTGAIETVLPHYIEGNIGIRRLGEGSLKVGNGEDVGVVYGEVEMEVRLGGSVHRWRAVVAFSDRRQYPVLGDAGFLRYFPVYFHRAGEYMEIDPPLGLPPT